MPTSPRRPLPRLIAALLLAGTVALGPAAALEPKRPSTDLDRVAFHRPEFHIGQGHVALDALRGRLANDGAWSRFFAEQGDRFHVWLDDRSGTPTNILGPIPLIPGRGDGNTLTTADLAASLGRRVAVVDAPTVGALVRQFIVRHADVFAIDTAQLGPVHVDHVDDALWSISIEQAKDGVPVRWGRIAATINSGNLVMIGTENWGNAQVDTRPALAPERALELGFEFAGGRRADDKLRIAPHLELLPFAPPALQAGERYAGPVGAGYGHRLAWVFSFVRPGVTGTWEVVVDAHDGTLLAFQDVNQYVKQKVTGAVYPVTNTGVCPDAARCGTMQAASPMPWADTGQSAPGATTNPAGVFDGTGGAISSALNGTYITISDTCGAISESSSAGALDFGGVNGQHDCTSAGASPGDTPSARSAFYELNKLAELARGWLPNNTWLRSQLRANVNLVDTCNAFFNGEANFYQSGAGCRNTGEIAAVFDHEWAHGLDANDTNSAKTQSGETYADIAAIYRLQMSCVGYGFNESNDKGCGRTRDNTGYNANDAQYGTAVCETDCSGVRGADYAKTGTGVPNTPKNFSCTHCEMPGFGPCGREEHCDARPATEAAWDFAARDLQGGVFHYDSATAFMIANKIFYQGSGNVGAWHACTCPSTSDGCGATNAYMQWLAADDDNGNVNDGTPHMSALRVAFNRHAIACSTPTVVNSGCAGAPSAATTVTATAGNGQATLTWTPVAGATKYWVLRTEGFAGCNFGKALIATVNGASYTDIELTNDRTYAYNVVAVANSNACFSPASPCVTVTPRACAGAVRLDRAAYNCHDTLGVYLADSDLAGQGTHAVAVSSTTEGAAETVTLTEIAPGSGEFRGTIATRAMPAVADDAVLSLAHGDAITVSYLDASACGASGTVATALAVADCAAPAITNVYADGIGGTGATVHWTTAKAADSSVSFGRSLPPALARGDDAPVTAHAVELRPLSECATYSYAVASTDAQRNRTVADNGGAYFTFTTPKNFNPVFTATDVPVPIPDSTPAGASSVIAIPDGKTVQDVNVTVNVTHGFDSDLALWLVGPTGTQVALSRWHGGSGKDYTATVFDDAAATPISDGKPPFTGTFRPDQALSSFNGGNSGGNWTLKVIDNASPDSGTIEGWSLQLLYPHEDCHATLRFEADGHACSGPVGLTVVDSTLRGQASLGVSVVSGAETTPESVVLTALAAPSDDTFVGTIGLTAAPALHGDGLLSVANGATITASYVAVNDIQNGQPAKYVAVAAVDCAAPVITATHATDVTPDSALVEWTTSEPATSVVRYGPGAPFAAMRSDAALVTAHAIAMTGLAACTSYQFDVSSADSAGNTATADHGGVHYNVITPRLQRRTYHSGGAPVAIPDNAPAGVASTITVADTRGVHGVDVAVNVDHARDGDLTLSLVAPNGATVVLAQQRGGDGANYSGTLFDDQAAAAIAAGTPPFTGAFRPEAPLAALDGYPAQGAWTLRVVDGATGGAGTLLDWSLQLAATTADCGAGVTFDASRVSDACLAGGVHAGDGVVDRGEDVVTQVTLWNSGTMPLTHIAATLSTATPGVTVTRAGAAFPDLAPGDTLPSLAPHFAFAVGPAVPCGTVVAFQLAIATDQGAFAASFTAAVGSPCNDCVTPVPTEEPAAQHWVSATSHQWEPIARASFYNVYRGNESNLPALLTPQPDSCLLATTTATMLDGLIAAPPAGGLWWYLVRAANPSGEGPAGPRQQDSTGTCP